MHGISSPMPWIRGTWPRRTPRWPDSVEPRAANDIFELFARYGARDFRSIGHKAIFVANSYRTLQCIGWQHAEPILRSLAYALLNHEGESNPADSDHEADRPWRENLIRAGKIRRHWASRRLDPVATEDLVQSFRTAAPDELCEQVVEMLNADVSPQSIFDAIFLAAGELLMRQPGIVALHALTTTNALHYIYRTAANDNTRRMVLLQNVAFLPMFREAMRGRGKVSEKRITDLADSVGEGPELSGIFDNVGSKSDLAAKQAYRFLRSQGGSREFMAEARRLIFLKGTDSHDYKFSSAVLEDHARVSSKWRDLYLAASVHKLRGAGGKGNGLVDRVREALA